LTNTSAFTKEKFQNYVGQLCGYLDAVSHLNDDFDQRHGFLAVSIDGNRSIEAELDEKLRLKNVQVQPIANYLEAIKLFSRMVRQNVFRNFLLGESLQNERKENFIKEQLQWHIEDFITLIETASGVEAECSVVLGDLEGFECQHILFVFGEHSMVVGFCHKHVA